MPSRLYYIRKRSIEGEIIEELKGGGDETDIIMTLVQHVFEDLTKMLEVGDVSVAESFDIVRGLENITKDAIIVGLKRPTDKIRVPLVDFVYEIQFATL